MIRSLAVSLVVGLILASVFSTLRRSIADAAPKTGSIITVAGNGKAGYPGDGGLAMEAILNAPAGLAFDPAGISSLRE